MSDEEEGREDQQTPEPQEDLLEHYNDMRIRKLYHYVMYEVTEDNVVKKRHSESGSPAQMSREKEFKKFVASLPDTDCRFIAYDHRYESPEGATMDKLVFIIW